MLAQADLLIAFKQYPHIDILERAQELVDLCAAQVAHGRRPVPSVVVKVAMIRSPDSPSGRQHGQINT